MPRPTRAPRPLPLARALRALALAAATLALLAGCGTTTPAGYEFEVWPEFFYQPRGEWAALGARAERLGGFGGAIEVSIVAPPQGVEADGTIPAGEPVGEVLVRVAADAELGPVDLTFVARAPGYAERRSTVRMHVLEEIEPTRTTLVR